MPCSGGVDVHFLNPDSGFFLRPEDSLGAPLATGVGGGDGGVLDVKRFTVLDPTRPTLIRAKYGPFSTKQTVPARYVLPEFQDEEEANVTEADLLGRHLPPVPHQLEVSAHLVNTEVTRAHPALRVLVHGAGARGHHSPHVCVTVIARRRNDALSASCTPTGAKETGGDATCLVTMAVPARWWPPHTRATFKLPRVAVQVSYLVGTAAGPKECAVRDAGGPNQGGPRVTVQPETPVGEVILTLDPHGYDELSSDPLVHVLVPRAPLHPATTIHAPLYLHPPGNLPALVLVLRCKVRGAVRVAGVEAASSAWNLTVEVNSRRSTATVTAMLSEPPTNDTLHNLGLHEVLSWVLEVPDDAVAGEARVTWLLRYHMDAHHHETFSVQDNRKMTTRLAILKDEIQAVLPIAKSWSVVNTAVLTGRQVSRAMKVLIVSQAGKVADVTLQSSCNCTDKAALKVSASCTSVYMDGSEVRGSHNATVIARYGERSGVASFTVWMPELPLTVHVGDTKLSQVRGWRAPDPASPGAFALKMPAGGGAASDEDLSLAPQEDPASPPASASSYSGACSVRYQQTPVQVYGRFVAVDDNSGRHSYLLSRRAQVRVTELVAHLLRVADTSVAILNHTTLMGRSPGRTEVQVLSPISGRVIGTREVRVGSDKVWVTKLRAAVISGLTLSLQPDAHLPDGYSAITAVTPVLTAKYQEGLVDVWVEMSDSVVMPLKEVPANHYVLRVRSLDPGVVAVAPSPRTAQPRIIAIGHGEGDLLEVSLEVADECERRRSSLANTNVHVKVDLGTTPPPPPIDPEEEDDVDLHENIPDDPTHHKLKVHVSELPHADAAAPQNHLMLMAEQPQQPTLQMRLHPPRHGGPTPLEVGMYVLLAVFGAALVVFAASCVVYTWRVRVGKPMLAPHQLHGARTALHNHHDSVTNAHDWVWLGRATLERASGISLSPPASQSGPGLVPLSDLNGNSQQQQLQQQQQEQQSAWLEYHRLSRGLERSAAPVNITENPGADEEESELTHSSRLTGSSTFTRPPRNGRRVTFNNLGDDAAASSSEEERPPVPPHRNIGVSANGNPDGPDGRLHDPRARHDDANPPPVPPHGVNVIANPLEDHRRPLDADKDDSALADPKFVEVNADDFVRLRGVCRGRAAQVRRATILENPLLSSALPDNFSVTDHLENLPPSMDYDQIMEYFSNLKESNA
ncbi:transmembrane protein 132E-like [Penaeus indicus]|uniref:transmembrane protein 132E-like n=1 Tax=Penaeus indicus TaxID=29960 RepID=UPI00300C6FFE